MCVTDHLVWMLVVVDGLTGQDLPSDLANNGPLYLHEEQILTVHLRSDHFAVFTSVRLCALNLTHWVSPIGSIEHLQKHSNQEAYIHHNAFPPLEQLDFF